MICCLLLSGGFSKRFRENTQGVSDKALYRINNKPMLLHVYEKLREICDPGNIIVSVRNLEQIKNYTRYIHEKITYAIDEVEGKGPLVALYSSLKYCREDYVVTIPNDTPFISINLLRDLINIVLKNKYDIISPMLPNTYIETLIMSARKDTLSIALELLVNRFRRSKVSDLHRGLPIVYLYNVERHGFVSKELINVNREHDLFQHREPSKLVDEDIAIDREFSLTDVEYRNIEKLVKSIWVGLLEHNFCSEFLYYMRKKSYYLAMQVLKDQMTSKKNYLEIKDLLETILWEIDK